MKIAVAGKGGSGKTTLAGTLARMLGRQGRAILAVDADSNPNLAITLGVPREVAMHHPAGAKRDYGRPAGRQWQACPRAGAALL